MPKPDDKKPHPNVDKKEVQAFIARQPQQTQPRLRKALKEHGILKDDKE